MFILELQKLLAILILVLLAAVIILVLPLYLDQREAAFIKGLEGKHPEGKSFVEETLKARAELKDNDKSNDFSAHARLGVFFNHLGEKQRAIENYQKALKISQKNILVLNNLAEIYSDLAQWHMAEFYWLKLIEFFPEQTMAYRSLGNLYRYRLNKTPGEIEQFFQKGLAATDHHPDLLTWLVAYFQEIGDNERFVKYANLLQEKSKQPTPSPSL